MSRYDTSLPRIKYILRSLGNVCNVMVNVLGEDNPKLVLHVQDESYFCEALLNLCQAFTFLELPKVLKIKVGHWNKESKERKPIIVLVFRF